PDDVVMTSKLKNIVCEFLHKGGGIISSGFSGLNADRTDFVFENWNIRYLGSEEWNIAYFKAVDDINEKTPDIVQTIYNQGISMHAGEGAEILAELHEPYFNKQWDGFHGYFYTPPSKNSGRPA